MPTREQVDKMALDEIQRTLTNHTPNVGQVNQIEFLRSRAKNLAADIVSFAPVSRSRSLALTHLEECVMRAVQAIVIPEVGE